MNNITHNDPQNFNMEPRRSYWWSDEAWEAVKPFLQVNEHDLRYGPGHIVFDDGNLEDQWIDWCLAEEANEAAQFTGERLVFVHDALLALKAVPEERRFLNEEN